MPAASGAEPIGLDGRQSRTARSRLAICEACLDLIQEGVLQPSADQVAETARLHFAGQENLVLVECDAEQLGEQLRWEASREGQLFPHFYGAIPVHLARRVLPLPLNEAGVPVVPDLKQ